MSLCCYLFQVIKRIGFEMEKCETSIKTKYCQNPQSMLQYEYDSVFFVCRKPISVENHRSDVLDSICDNEISFNS